MSAFGPPTAKKDPDFKGRETALLGTKIWRSLRTKDEAFISISATRKSHKLVCWAVHDEQTSGIALPPQWFTKFQGLHLTVTVVQPVLLTQVFISALSDEAYRIATSYPSLLESWLSGDHNILRQDSLHSFSSDLVRVNGSGTTSPSTMLQYRVELLEPVLQGFALSGTTKFCVTSVPDALVSPSISTDQTEDAIEFEIDEDFLANSVIHPSLRPSAPTGPSSTQARSEACFTCQEMNEPVSVLDDECTLYVRTPDLGRVGILYGDWAVAHCTDYRLVRVTASDDMVATSGTVAGSPILLRNIGSKVYPSTSGSVWLHPSPFGSGQPAIPTARVVTLARVASPYSTSRAFQTQFLRALKDRFAVGRRLVKKGDLVAIPIDTDLSALHENNEEDGLADDSFPIATDYANEIIYFVITNIEHDVISCDETSGPDLYIGCTTGELGCWFEPTSTRMVQTGVEHLRVPDASRYLQMAGRTILEPSAFPCLCGRDTPYQKLLVLLSATLERNAVDYRLHLSILLKGARGVGKLTTARSVCHCLGIHFFEVNCFDILGESDVKTEALIRSRFEKAAESAPCMLFLRHLEALTQTTQPGEPGKEPNLAHILRECIEDLDPVWRRTGYPVVVCGTMSDASRVPTAIQACFKHEVTFQAPSETERLEILKSLLKDFVISPDVSLRSLATQTAALLSADLCDLVVRAEVEATKQACRISSSSESDIIHAGIPLSDVHFEEALRSARSSYSESIGAPKIPTVSWDDVGGLAHVKSDILDTIQLPLEHPELFAAGLKKRSGILLYGPPGTGKTLVAKAVATSFSLNFFSVKGPELLNMYIGESEANVRRVFQRARDAKPCVIFFDELDSIAPKRGNHGDSGGVMDRIVSQLLAELDGMSDASGGADVFVLGATNRPDLLDPALLRPGRFDRMLYLGVSTTHTEQLNILKALTRKFVLSSNVDLAMVAESCPFNYTGADFYALCADALLNAMTRTAENLDRKIDILNHERKYSYTLTAQYYLAEVATKAEMEVMVTQEDFERALKSLVPSVSETEMKHYARIQQRFSEDRI